MQANHADKDVTLLLVDDDDVDVMGVKRALKKLQITNPVVRARDGIEGLAKLRECSASHKPYLVLLDLNLPRMNGLELTNHIRAGEIGEHMPIVMVTSRVTDKHRQMAAQVGVDAYLNKPWTEEDLMKLVQEQLPAA